MYRSVSWLENLEAAYIFSSTMDVIKSLHVRN